ncbi:MAG: hypothetical protein GF331_23915 [Chitinivibrionales bacterium]|nr:hypothetical protein [Chitinivibrionales bacterium]
MTVPSDYLSILAAAAVTPSDEPEWDAAIPAGEKRRSPRIWRMASVAAQRALDAGTVTPRSLVVATALGALDETREFLARVYTEGLGSPRNFIASVHNSMGGKLAQQFGIDGPNLTICDGQCSTASAIVAADLLDTSDFPVLLIAVDESVRMLEELLPFFPPQCRQFLTPGWKDGAVALLCGREGDEGRARIRALGPTPAAEEAVDETVAQLCAGLDNLTKTIPTEESSADFVRPAALVEQCVRQAQPGRYAIPSYSPTAGAVAVIDLCI